MIELRSSVTVNQGVALRDVGTLSALGEEALALAEEGMAVFPLFEPTGVGCSCGDAACSGPGKHPRTQNGFRDASTDPLKIKRWWTKNPNANVGVATGEGFVVVDIDGPEGEISAKGLEL